MAHEIVTLEFLARPSQQTLQEVRAIRADVAELRTYGLQTVDCLRRIEHRVNEWCHGMETRR
jgi:hypothetical protein